MRKLFFLLFTTSLVLLPRVLSAAELLNPLDPEGTGNVTITTIIGRIIQAILGITGAVALFMFIWGGFQWLFSAGNPDWVKKGKETMKWAILGLAVIVGAYMIVSTIVSALESGTVG